jgi:integrase
MNNANPDRGRPKAIPAGKIPLLDHIAWMAMSASELKPEVIKQYFLRYRMALALILDLDPSLADVPPALRIDEAMVDALAQAFAQTMSLAKANTALGNLRTVYRHVLPELDVAVFDPTLDRLRIALAKEAGEPDEPVLQQRGSYALPIADWPAEDRAAYHRLLAQGEPRTAAYAGDWGRFLGVAAHAAPKALLLPLRNRLTSEAIAAYALHTSNGSIQIDNTARLRTLKVVARRLDEDISVAAVDDHIAQIKRPDCLSGGLTTFGSLVLATESDPLLSAHEAAVLDNLPRLGAENHDDVAEVTALHCAYSYRAMLAHAARAGIPIQGDLAARDWPAILAAFLEARPGWQPATRQSRLVEIRAVVRRLEIGIDCTFLDEAIEKAKAEVTSKRKPIEVPDIDAACLLEAAVRLCHDAMRRLRDLDSVEQPYTDPLGALERFRDGLVAALMTLVPLRVGNFSQLVVDVTFSQRPAGGYDIEIPASKAKGGRRLVEEVPEALAPLMKFYLDVVRPRLLGDMESSALWPNPVDGGPLSVSWFQRKVPDLVDELTGHRLKDQRVTPHDLRRIAATTARAVNPNPNVGQHLLGHANARTTQRFYGKMSDVIGRAVIREISRQALGRVVAENGLDVGHAMDEGRSPDGDAING